MEGKGAFVEQSVRIVFDCFNCRARSDGEGRMLEEHDMSVSIRRMLEEHDSDARPSVRTPSATPSPDGMSASLVPRCRSLPALSDESTGLSNVAAGADEIKRYYKAHRRQEIAVAGVRAPEEVLAPVAGPSLPHIHARTHTYAHIPLESR
jgi:hypothetical protein